MTAANNRDNTNKNNAGLVDPCADFGPVQRRALIWFAVMLTGGFALTAVLCRIDDKMYRGGAMFLDYPAHVENRRAIYSVPSERVDPRANGGFSEAVQRLKANKGK